jgi:hypothetical protein
MSHRERVIARRKVMRSGQIRRELIAGVNGLYLDSRGGTAMLEDCKRRGARYRPCGMPATHILRTWYFVTKWFGNVPRLTPRQCNLQLCELHAREAAKRWWLEFPELAGFERIGFEVKRGGNGKDVAGDPQRARDCRAD